jgi:hypothetical protein
MALSPVSGEQSLVFIRNAMSLATIPRLVLFFIGVHVTIVMAPARNVSEVATREYNVNY